MWIVIIAVIAGLIFLGILIISTPFDLAWSLKIYGRPELSLRWGWFWGLIKGNIRARRRPRGIHRRRVGFQEILNNLRSVQGFLSIKGLWAKFFHFLKKLLKNIRIRKLEADFLIGPGDPAETFYLFALVEPINRLIGSIQPYPMNIRLSFIEPVLEGYFQGDLRIYPIRLIPPILQFGFSVPVFRLIKKAVWLKWRKNG